MSPIQKVYLREVFKFILNKAIVQVTYRLKTTSFKSRKSNNAKI